jgi:type I restriction enzyme R subunit
VVLDRREGHRTHSVVKVEIEKELDQGLPQKYDAGRFREKADAVYGHVFDSYWGDGRSVYSAAA